MAAGFVIQRRIDLLEMAKIKLLLLIFFLFVFQISFLSAQNADMIFVMNSNIENQPQNENNYVIQNISVEFSKNQFDALYNKQTSKCFLSNNNFKYFQVSIVQCNLMGNSVMQEHLCNAGPVRNVINVPIYLQTEKFRL